MTKHSPSLSLLLCFSLLVTRALINHVMRIIGKTKSHRWSISTYSVWSLTPTAYHTTRCSLSLFQGPFFQVDQGQPVPESICPLSTLTVMSLSVCILYWAATLSMQSGTTSSHLLNNQLTIIGMSDCITKRAPKKLKSTQLPALIMVVRDRRTKWNDKTLQSPVT